ncbi:5654_t:CDS:2, partial [Dentiscutata heterogama]
SNVEKETDTSIVEGVLSKYEEPHQQQKETYYRTNKLEKNQYEALAIRQKHTNLDNLVGTLDIGHCYESRNEMSKDNKYEMHLNSSKDAESYNNANDDEKSWYLCSDKFPEDWLNPNEHRNLINTEPAQKLTINNASRRIVTPNKAEECLLVLMVTK